MDNILYQRYQPCGFRMDQAGKMGNVLLLDHPVFQQFRTAQDRLQRRFQLIISQRNDQPMQSGWRRDYDHYCISPDIKSNPFKHSGLILWLYTDSGILYCN